MLYSFFLFHFELKRQINVLHSTLPLFPRKSLHDFRPKCKTFVPVFRPKRRKINTLWGGTYPYGLKKGVELKKEKLRREERVILCQGPSIYSMLNPNELPKCYKENTRRHRKVIGFAWCTLYIFGVLTTSATTIKMNRDLNSIFFRRGEICFFKNRIMLRLERIL